LSVNVYDKTTGTLTALASSGQRTWVGTEIQYKAAQQAGTLPNNAIICITDDEVDTSHYSENETFTGMYWIDGKPIYRKVFKSSGTTTISNAFTNLGEIISLTGVVYRTDGNIIHAITGADESNLYGCYVYYKKDTNTINFQARNISVSYVLLIIEYTKTDD